MTKKLMEIIQEDKKSMKILKAQEEQKTKNLNSLESRAIQNWMKALEYSERGTFGYLKKHCGEEFENIKVVDYKKLYKTKAGKYGNIHRREIGELEDYIYKFQQNYNRLNKVGRFATRTLTLAKEKRYNDQCTKCVEKINHKIYKLLDKYGVDITFDNEYELLTRKWAMKGIDDYIDKVNGKTNGFNIFA